MDIVDDVAEMLKDAGNFMKNNVFNCSF